MSVSNPAVELNAGQRSADANGAVLEEARDAVVAQRGIGLTALIAAVIGSGMALFALGLAGIGTLDWQAVVILGLLAVLAERLNVSLYGDARLSLAFVPIFASLILFGLPGLVIVAPLSAISVATQKQRPVYKIAFNAGALIISGAIAIPIFRTLSPSAGVEAWPEVLPSAALAAAVNFFVNSLLVAGAVSLSTKRALPRVWSEHFGWLGPHYIVLGVLGLAIATAYAVMGVWGIAVFLAPVLMTLVSFKQYVDKTTGSVLELRRANKDLEQAHLETTNTMEQLSRAYEGTLRSLASALDARDTETGGHSTRVTALTMAVAEEMGLVRDSDEWRNLERGALLHDVGKIAVPDHILRKPSRLDPDEWEIMRTHPLVGFEILRSVDFLQKAADIVRAHHESFDGSGYPAGLAGESIPLGARIFAVGDAFDAMTQDRPYRKGMPSREALAEILRCSGSQFDPEVVSAFLSVYRHKFVREDRSPLDSSELIEDAVLEANLGQVVRDAQGSKVTDDAVA